MTAVSANKLMKLVLDRMTDVLASRGYAPHPPWDGQLEAPPGVEYPDWRFAWFAKTGTQDLTPAIEVQLIRDGSGVELSGVAELMADAVAPIRTGLPEAALTLAGNRIPAMLESIDAGFFQHPRNVGAAKIWFASASDVDAGVDRFLESVDGPVGQWFAQRSSLEDLLQLAPHPNLTFMDRSNPDPVRLRCVVILALLGGRTRDAVTLMRWYLQRAHYNHWDSREQALAFDAAMTARFPDYAAAQQH